MAEYYDRKGRYRTIVADPPWPYPEGFGIGRIPAGEAHDGRRQALPYSDMTLDQIKALPVPELADDNAHLWLWTTNRYLRDSFDVVEAWGFRFGQIVVWAKKPMSGVLGGAFSPNVEFVLFCRRGSLKHLDRQPSQWFEWKRQTGHHSRKPDAFIDLVERVSPGPRVELFARRARFGWDYWGDESLGTAEMVA